MELVSREIAEREVNSWLEYKKIPQAYRGGIGTIPFTEGMIISIQEGTFTFDPETKTITHKLKFPIDNISELKYQPRITTGKLQANMLGVSSTDESGRSMAIIAAISGHPRTEIAMMDLEDLRAAKDVAAFFSP